MLSGASSLASCGCFASWCIFACYLRLFGLLVRLRLLRAVVLLIGASSRTARACFAYWCMCLRLLRAVDLLIVAWVLAYYVRLFDLSVRLRSMCACFVYIGASSLTMCVCFASCCVFTICALVLLIGASSLTTCGCSACWCVFNIASLVAFQHFTCRCRRVLISQSRPSQQTNLRMDASLSCDACRESSLSLAPWMKNKHSSSNRLLAAAARCFWEEEWPPAPS